MDADLVGFQEVFHEEALGTVCARSGRFDDATVIAPGARTGTAVPGSGLATRLPLAEPATAITDFPAGVDAPVDGIALPVGTFSRPVLRARVLLHPTTSATATVFVVHLKSKRPIRDPLAAEHDPREEALGKARSLIRRAAEAAALRFLLLEEIVGNWDRLLYPRMSSTHDEPGATSVTPTSSMDTTKTSTTSWSAKSSTTETPTASAR